MIDSETPPTMNMWVIYDHPRDFPEHFVMRRHVIGAGWHGPTSDVRIANTYEDLVQHVPEGAIRLAPNPGDDPALLEMWI